MTRAERRRRTAAKIRKRLPLVDFVGGVPGRLAKQIPSGRVDPSCGPHSGCPWCLRNRMHKHRRRLDPRESAAWRDGINSTYPGLMDYWSGEHP